MPRLRKTPEAKLAELQEKAAGIEKRKKQVKAQIAAENAKLKKQARKLDTHCKVIAGALALEHRDKNPGSEFAKVMTRLLNEYVDRPEDRAYFGLPPRPGNDALRQQFKNVRPK